MSPLYDSLSKESSVLLVLAMGAGLVNFVLTCVAYTKGAYYQTYQSQQIVDGQTYSTVITGEDDCKTSFTRNHAFDDALDTCPKEVYVLASLVCAGISLVFSITLLLKLLDKSDIQSLRGKLWLMVPASIGMCVACLLLIRFLISVHASNYPDCSHINSSGNGQTVESNAVPAPTEEDFKSSCEPYMDHYFKHRLLIAATVCAIVSGVYHMLPLLLLKSVPKSQLPQTEQHQQQ